MSAKGNMKRRGGLAGMALMLGWGALALVAVWHWWPSSAAYVPPAGWTRFAPELAVQDMLIGEGRMLAAGIGGLYEISADGRTRKIDLSAVPEFSTEPMLRALAKDAQGRIWIGHQYGLAIMESEGQAGQRWSTPTFEGGSAPGAIRALAVDAEGAMWAGGDRGLFRSGGNSTTLIAVPLPQEGVEISTLMFDRENGLWIGTMGHGVFRFKEGAWSHWTVKDGLPHPQVTSFLTRKDGAFLCGTGFYNKGGVAVFRASAANGGEWRLPETLPSTEFAGEKVRSIFEDAQGRLWLGHEYDGITIRQDGKTVRFVKEADGLPDMEVTLILPRTDGGLWLGTMKGLVRLSPAAVKKLITQTSGGIHGS
jgi:ligand-binding sensor domain-containing protein